MAFKSGIIETKCKHGAKSKTMGWAVFGLVPSFERQIKRSFVEEMQGLGKTWKYFG